MQQQKLPQKQQTQTKQQQKLPQKPIIQNQPLIRQILKTPA